MIDVPYDAITLAVEGGHIGRIQVQLTQHQLVYLRYLSGGQGVLLAGLITKGVDGLVTAKEKNRKEVYAMAARAIGALDNKKAATGIALRHDEHLEKAYE